MQRDHLDLSVLGTQLSERILQAQNRFAAIQKKCDHSVIERLDGCVSEGVLGAHRQGVGFKKDGNSWKLYFVEEGEYEREPREFEAILGREKIRQYYLKWRELSQASLVEKSKAVKLLPKLFTEMQAEYDRRTKLVGDALLVLNELDAHLPPAVTEGE